ncbi:MAG: hypothetical protein GYB65_12250 [Chloroflexi bacterium]|nr:hypothetical protein [Chloroflexota bacterium]
MRLISRLLRLFRIKRKRKNERGDEVDYIINWPLLAVLVFVAVPGLIALLAYLLWPRTTYEIVPFGSDVTPEVVSDVISTPEPAPVLPTNTAPAAVQPPSAVIDEPAPVAVPNPVESAPPVNPVDTSGTGGLLATPVNVPITIGNAGQLAQVTRLEGHQNPVNSVAFSADGGWIVSGSPDGVLLTQVDTRASPAGMELPQTLPSESLSDLAVDPDEAPSPASETETVARTLQVVVASPWETNELYFLQIPVTEGPEGAQVQVIRQLSLEAGPSNTVNSVAFSPDGRWLAAGSTDRNVYVWDAATYQLQQTLTGHTRSVTSVTFSPDSTMLASGAADGELQVWNPESGESLLTLPGTGSAVKSLAFDAGGVRLASGGDDSLIRLWNPFTGESLGELTGHSGWVTSLSFSPTEDALLASGSNGGQRDDTVRLWDVSDLAAPLLYEESFDGNVNDVAFSPDGVYLVVGDAGGAKLGLWGVTELPTNLAGELEPLDTGSGTPIESAPAPTLSDTAAADGDTCIMTIYETGADVYDQPGGAQTGETLPPGTQVEIIGGSFLTESWWQLANGNWILSFDTQDARSGFSDPCRVIGNLP